MSIPVENPIEVGLTSYRVLTVLSFDLAGGNNHFSRSREGRKGHRLTLRTPTDLKVPAG